MSDACVCLCVCVYDLYFAWPFTADGANKTAEHLSPLLIMILILFIFYN